MQQKLHGYRSTCRRTEHITTHLTKRLYQGTGIVLAHINHFLPKGIRHG
jgi:hypothetical protein